MKRSHDNRLSFGFISAGDEDNCDVQKILDRIVPPSGLLRGVRRFETDVSGLPVDWRWGPSGSHETPVSNHLTPRNNLEVGRIEFNRGGSLRSRKQSAIRDFACSWPESCAFRHGCWWRVCEENQIHCPVSKTAKRRHARTGHEGPEVEQTSSSTLSLTSALDRSGWLTPRPGKESWCPFYRRLGEPQGRSGRVQKISPPPGFDPRTVQPVASHNAEWAVPAHRGGWYFLQISFRISAHLLISCFNTAKHSKQWVA
jgi:hypothetical protein